MPFANKETKQVSFTVIKDVIKAIETATPRKGRIVVALVGAPGAGKSTIAKKLIEKLSPAVALIKADDFRIPHLNLGELGNKEHTNAPDAFEVEQLVTVLHDIKTGESTFHPECSIILVEGDYLLSHNHGWEKLADLIDVSFFVETKGDDRVSRLIERHLGEGMNLKQAMATTFGIDEQRAHIITPTAKRATYLIRLSD